MTDHRDGPSSSATASVRSLIAAAARRAPHAPALLAPGCHPLAWADVLAGMDAVGGALHRLGVRRGDRVAVVLPAGREMALAFLGAAARATCAPLHPGYRERECERALCDLQPKALLLAAAMDSPARTVAASRRIPMVEVACGPQGTPGRLAVAPEGEAPPCAEVAPDDVALILHTSGTTARPKQVPLTHANLCASARQIALSLALGPDDVCLDVMPLFHIHGLMTLLAALAAGGRAVCPPAFDALAFMRWLVELAPTWYSAVPTMHQAILAEAARHRAALSRHPLRFVRSCSAPLPPAVAAELERVFGVPVIEAYGMTEAAHQIASNPLPPGERKPGSVGIPTGTEVAILDEAGRRLPAGEAGEIAIRGPNVTAGYADDPMANAAAFTGGWLRTGDQGQVDGDGYVFLTGRLKDLINRGGEKIAPREVEEVLLAHPAVAEAVAFGVPHPTLGEDVAAAVVPRAGAAVSEAALRAHVAGRLVDAKVPGRVVLVAALPTGATGKVPRRGLAEHLGLQPSPAAAPACAAPGTPLETRVAAIWGEVLGRQRVGAHENFFELGGDSLRATQVLARVQAAFGVELRLPILFMAPTVAALAEAIAAARPGVPASAEVPAAAEGPLSFAQERLWFLEYFDPSAAVYNRPTALRLTGRLDAHLLEKSLGEILRRHEVLRATFPAVAGRPAQVITPPWPVEIPVADLAALPPSAREEEARRLAIQEANRPFDLGGGPLVRTRLIRLGPEDHLLVVVLHHLVFDGWSEVILLGELTALYAAFAEEQPSPLPDLPLQYAAFARRQREWLRGEELERHLSYWTRRLEGAPSFLDLPTDHPRPAVPRFRGARHQARVDGELTAALRALGRQEDATLFMILLAAFTTLLSRHTGQEDVVVGVPIAGRTHRDVEGLIGLFTNTLAFRTDMSGGPTFRDLLKRVREVAVEAYAHQDLPFEKLVEALRVPRHPSRTPVFQVMLNLRNIPEPVLGVTGLGLEPFAFDRGVTAFDLSLDVAERPDGLSCSFEYSADLFEPATVARLAGHFHTLLQGIVADPSRPLAALPILTEPERRQLLVAWNAAGAREATPSCVHRLIEAQAARTPGAVAVVCDDRRLPYGELNRRANRLAHHLRNLGVGPEVPVGVLLERGAEAIVALLAILKAGGAYVPLDPRCPPARLAFTLADAGIPVVLTEEPGRSALGAEGPRVVCLDTEEDAIGRESAETPAGGATPDTLAYVIYTSGSTGDPKGVMVSHGVLASHCESIARLHDITPRDRVLQFSALTFDASLEQILPTLISGATLVLRGHALWTPAEFHTRAMECGITIADLPTAYCAQLARAWAAAPDRFPDPRFRLVIVGVEPLRADSLQHWRRTPAASARLINAYGPTEGTITATAFEVPRAAVETASGAVPIGRPLPGRTAYILDPHGNPVPVGVPGELYLGGAGLARGYLHRPALTAERFVPDPFGDKGGARIYRTGDRARYLPDGTIEFLGRSDDQVKIRGFRVELGEIEAALARHPAVREAAAVVREDTPGDARLVAYVIPAGAAPPQEPDLRRFLRETLPDYMLPSAIVCLEAPARTPSGKVDRRALPPPDWSAVPGPGAFEPPRSPVEEAVASVWADVLGRDRVGIHHSFFELGGHSLLATQVVARLREIFGVDVPLRHLFETPTVADLSDAIETALRGPRVEHGGAIRPAPRDGILPLSSAQLRFWLLDQIDPGNPAFNAPSIFRIRGPVDAGALAASLQAMVDRHESLRTTFAVAEGKPVQMIAPQLALTVPVIDLGHLPPAEREQEVWRRCAEDVHGPFDLVRGPLVRAMLLRLGEQDHVLYFNLHHIICDAWSMAVLQREIAEVYGALVIGRAPALPHLPLQCADFAVWQERWLRCEASGRQLAYWRERLRDAPDALELPADRPRPPRQSFCGARQTRTLPRHLSQALAGLSARESASLFMILLAAFQLLLHRLTGSEDLCVGAPVAGRDRVELEGMVGCFLNTLVLRTDLSGNPTFRELLGRTRETCLGAYAHQEVPFERLLEEIRLQRDARRTPLVQVLLNMHNFADDQLPLPGLVVEKIRPTEAHALFDLTLYYQELGTGIQLTLGYNVDLFGAPRMLEFLAQFERLLEQAVADPDRHLAEFSLVTAAARAVLPDPAAPLPSDWHGAVHEGFVRQARRVPDRLAVTDGRIRWTYGELDARSNQLAHALRARGVRREDIVAIWAQRSAPLVWAVLATLKAGAAFLILDPAYPETALLERARRAHPRAWIEVAGAGMPPGELESFARAVGCRFQIGPGPGDASPSLAARPVTDPGVAVTPDGLACLTFTSGSTGRPHGVLGRHGALSHFLPWQVETYRFGETDRFSMLSGLAHDPLQRDMFTPLWVGASLHIPDPDEYTTPGCLAEWASREQITVANLTPATIALLAEGAPDHLLPTLRQAFVVGDVLTRRDVARLRRIAPRVTVVNLYGTTETQRALAHFPVPDAPEETEGMAADALPLGGGVPGMQMLVLTPTGHLAGVGEPGEIFVRSPHLARGYLGDDELTAARFLPNPFSGSPGDRLYRTGDRARYRPDGTLEFLGRTDAQITLRGFRVEPAEIEAALAAHPGVREAVIAVQGDPVGGKRLVAYVVPAGGPAPAAGMLQRFVAERLPDYMVPSALVQLDALPLTPAGKVDRRALPAPDVASAGPGVTRIPPRDALERELARMWEEILGVRPVGIQDNFFELGGHSLLAVRLFAELARATGRRLPLADLFRGPTIERLADLIRREAPAMPWSALVPLQPGGGRPPLFCVHQHTGHLFCYRNLVRHLPPDQPVYGLVPRGLDGRQSPWTRIEEMAAHYVREIRTVQPVGPYHLAGYCFGGIVAFEIAQQLTAQGERVGMLALIESAWWDRNTPRARRVAVHLRRRLAFERDQVLGLARPERIPFLLRRAAVFLGERLGGLAARAAHVNARTRPAERGMRRAIRHIETAHSEAHRHYVPRVYPGRIVHFRPGRSWARHHGDPTWGWCGLAAGGIDIHEIPTTRPTILDEPDVRILAERMRACLPQGSRTGEEP